MCFLKIIFDINISKKYKKIILNINNFNFLKIIITIFSKTILLLVT
jgi:hypothetical protein